jgi:hypothetical protein
MANRCVPGKAEPTGKDFSRVRPNVSIALPGRACAVRSRVAGWAACRVALDRLPSLRQNPGPFPRGPLPTAFLKHADEQTVAGMAAVSRAIHGHGLKDHDFGRWAVIASPRFLGRAALAVALARVAAEGAWGISPHLIPHRSLHALSGTVSQALKIHGPNYGVGGGADGAAEALLAASAVLADGEVPGLWVILTGFDPELVPPDPTDTTAARPVAECIAVALALMPEGNGQPGWFLSIGVSGEAARSIPPLPLFTLEGFAATLAQPSAPAHWRLRCGGWTLLEHLEATGEICP